MAMSIALPQDKSSLLPPFGLPLSDIDLAVEHSASDLRTFMGARLLLTGGTGFLGSWILTHILRANERLNLKMRLVVLSRDPAKLSFESQTDLEIVRGDVRSFPRMGSFDVVIHGAASSVRMGEENTAARIMSTVVLGTEAVLEAVAGRGSKFLFLSSGAVYGPQLSAVAETSLKGPDPMSPHSAYAESKRLAETLCAEASESGDVSAVVARLFAFVGPRIPLDAHFAVGNFLRDVIAGKPIEIRGDGSPYRSYLYAGDLAEWCWALLARGMPGRAFNVGSPEPVTVAELAGRVARLASQNAGFQILETARDEPAAWYVPVTARAESELGLHPRVDLDVALEKTLQWFRTQ